MLGSAGSLIKRFLRLSRVGLVSNHQANEPAFRGIGASQGAPGAGRLANQRPAPPGAAAPFALHPSVAPEVQDFLSSNRFRVLDLRADGARQRAKEGAL
jgi:hypothetical protein